MTNSVSGSSSSPSSLNSQVSSVISSDVQAKLDSGGGGTHTVYGMTMDEKDYKKFTANLMKSVVDQIKSDEASYNQTQQQILQDEQEENG